MQLVNGFPAKNGEYFFNGATAGFDLTDGRERGIIIIGTASV